MEILFVDKIPATKIPGVVYDVLDGKAAKLSNGNSGHVTWRDDEKRVFDKSCTDAESGMAVTGF